MKPFDDKHQHQEPNYQEHNKRIWSHWRERLAHMRRKMSRGAANIFIMMRSRSKWGNKNLWRSKDKGGHGRTGGGE